jgi:DNA repair protein RecO (recombination protein O)
MIIEDEGIIISKLKYGENSLIIKIFTRENGVCSGLLKGIKKYGAVAQVGNFVKTEWKGRLTEHLGNFSLELLKPYSSDFFSCYKKMLALNSASAVLAKVMPEKESYKQLYFSYIQLLDSLRGENWVQDYVMFELNVLQTMGFGLDLASCVATGTTSELVYISPKSGAAVSRDAGQAYHDKLFQMPTFFRDGSEKATSNTQEILEGLRITRYFMAKYLFAEFNYSMPSVCHEFFENITKAYAEPASAA